MAKSSSKVSLACKRSIASMYAKSLKKKSPAKKSPAKRSAKKSARKSAKKASKRRSPKKVASQFLVNMKSLKPVA